MTNDNKWVKSSRCAAGNCVEVKIHNNLVEVRDTSGDIVMYTYGEWKDFIEGVKNNEFDI